MKSANQLPAVSRIQTATRPLSAPRRWRATPLAWLFAAFALSCLAPANAIAQATPPAILALGTHSDINLNLILPGTTTDGKIYYFLDASGNGEAGATDKLMYPSLAPLLNSGGANPLVTQEGAHDGSDDERSVIVSVSGSDYAVVLPTIAELRAYKADAGTDFSTFPVQINAGEFIAADRGILGGTHSTYYYFDDSIDSTAENDVSDTVLFQVLFLSPIFDTATIADQTYPTTGAIPTLTLPAASGGTGDLTYTLTPTSSLTALGLAFDPVNRTLSGTTTATPTAATLTYTVTDSATTPTSASLTFTVTVADPSLTLTPTTPTLTEGATTTYTVALATEPTGPVTVTIAGHGDVTPAPTTLSFTTTDWATAQTVTLTAAEDDDAADDVATLMHTASGGDYASVTADLAVTVTDNDTAGLTLSLTTLTLDEGATTPYTAVLDTEPTDTVTVSIGGDGDVTPAPTTLTFTTSTWATPQTVTLTAAEDVDAADDVATLTHTASGGDYGSVTADLAVTVTDNDIGLVLMPASLTLDEGATTTYSVALSTLPSADVVVDYRQR